MFNRKLKRLLALEEQLLDKQRLLSEFVRVGKAAVIRLQEQQEEITALKDEANAQTIVREGAFAKIRQLEQAERNLFRINIDLSHELSAVREQLQAFEDAYTFDRDDDDDYVEDEYLARALREPYE